VAVVLGATDGDGEAYAEAVAQRGVNVALVARRQAMLETIAERIERETGARARAWRSICRHRMRRTR
jgi:short-subunit dehydrogenase